MEVEDGLVGGDEMSLPVPEEKMLEKAAITIPPRKMTPTSVPQPMGLVATRAPHFEAYPISRTHG